ncbi:hypothetical protein PS922_02445 [Pseudomonas fluorescens]|jgi:hypothetical protein|uniref:Uncharacterized protein n=1 Tax=Pseudomonas fluorescens TaxID=294 RepID=A0A5E7SQU9_PSEFL|nr:hypothetical protein PS922_02445 [Pseudomonas fluorescens]
MSRSVGLREDQRLGRLLAMRIAKLFSAWQLVKKS